MVTYSTALVFFLFAASMLLLAFFKPSIALPWSRSRSVALCFWAVCVMLSAVYARSIRPPDADLSPQERHASDWQTFATWPASIDRDGQEKQQTQQTLQDLRMELIALLYELETMRSSKRFHERRFEPDNKPATEWKTKLELVQMKLEAFPGVTPMKEVPRLLYKMALHLAHNAGLEDDMTQALLESIQRVLKQ